MCRTTVHLTYCTEYLLKIQNSLGLCLSYFLFIPPKKKPNNKKTILHFPLTSTLEVCAHRRITKVFDLLT